VLANVFEHSEYPPGVYKVLVTIVAEQASNERGFRQNAGDDAQTLFDRVLRGEFMSKTAQMREKALNTMDDEFGIKADDWMALQGQKIDALRTLETTLSDRMRDTAVGKIAAVNAHMRDGLALAGGVLVVSMVLGIFIGRGVSRSVSSLSEAAKRVQEDKDFSVRATAVSNDELGKLTEAFNEMLSGIQTRDSELEGHRHNLEALVNARTAELSQRNDAMRIVLDNVEQGLATIHLDGTLARETSASFARWFGAPAEQTTLGTHMQVVSHDVGLAFRLGWDSIVDDILPWELSLEQMPRKVRANGRFYELTYRPILADNKLTGALMVVSDVTEALEQERRAREQQEALNIFEHIMQDRHGFNEFMQEVSRLVDVTRKPEAISVQDLMRTVHTVKGNCSIFGVNSIAAIAHELESFIVEQQAVPEPEALAALQDAWSAFDARIQKLHGDDEESIELQRSELAEIIDNAERRAPHEQLAQQLRELSYEPVERRFQRLAERAKTLASRLGKAQLEIEQDAGLVRLPAEPWAEFWGSFVHVVRNAIDHGLETNVERTAAHKSGPAKLKLTCKRDGSNLVIEVSDNGRGIAWERVREKARSMGLPHTTREDLEKALFTDGLSTRDAVSDTSGRGVGMGAVREACVALGGRIEVQSELGQGTTFRFSVPAVSSAHGQRKVA
jgi:two-component system chemotaxis sensor kinase CheA